MSSIVNTKETNDKVVELASKYTIKVIGKPNKYTTQNAYHLQLRKPHNPTLTNPLYPPDIEKV
jgi:hypothetical protein